MKRDELPWHNEWSCRELDLLVRLKTDGDTGDHNTHGFGFPPKTENPCCLIVAEHPPPMKISRVSQYTADGPASESSYAINEHGKVCLVAFGSPSTSTNKPEWLHSEYTKLTNGLRRAR